MRGLKATSQLLTTKTSPFLRLPAEIRTQIYGYLLLTRYTKYYPVAEDAVSCSAKAQLVVVRTDKTY